MRAIDVVYLLNSYFINTNGITLNNDNTILILKFNFKINYLFCARL